MSRRTPRHLAREVAAHLFTLIEPHCERIEVVGSLRRGNDPKDLDILAMPRDLFALHTILAVTQEQSDLVTNLETGEKRTQFMFAPLVEYGGNRERYRMKVELWLANHHNWGIKKWLRTGPGDANKSLVTRLKGIDAPYRMQDGYLVHVPTGQQVSTPTEQSVFDLWGIPYIEPAHRRWGKYLQALSQPDHTFQDVATLATITEDNQARKTPALLRPALVQ